MKTVEIYLSGGMGKFGKENYDESNLWRVYCKNALERCESTHSGMVVNPNDYFNFIDEPQLYKTNREVMNLDLYKLRNCDLVIVNFNDKNSLGTMAEIAIAYDRRIPVIGLNQNNEELHPWQIEMCERVFGDIDSLIDYVEDFYLR